MNVTCKGWRATFSCLKKRYPCILTSQFCTTFFFILVAAKKNSKVYLFGGFFFIDEILVVFANMDPNRRA
jgi:hypothetical protein